MRMISKLYKHYNEGKDIFVRPDLHFKLSTWRNNHCLPVWRRGPIIYFGKSDQYDTDYSLMGAWAKGTKWNEGFLKSCSKFGRWWRSFIKPTYQLPIWLAFGVYSSSLGYKSKYDDWVFEYNPYLSIVFFGLCACWWTTPPKSRNSFSDDFYWESFMQLIWDYKGNVTPANIIDCGVISTTQYTEEEQTARKNIRDKYKNIKYGDPGFEEASNKRDKELKKYPGVEIRYFTCQREYLKPEYWKTYDEACSKYMKMRNKDKFIFLK